MTTNSVEGAIHSSPTSLSQAEERGDIVKVLFPLPLSKAYDYLAPSGQRLVSGAWVRAPFGPREIYGVVWRAGDDQSGDDIDPAKLKKIGEIVQAPPLSAQSMAFIDWVSGYTMFPLGAVLRLLMRSGDGLALKKPITAYRRSKTPLAKITPKREKALKVLGGDCMSVRALSEKAGVGDGVIRGLIKAGALTPEHIDPDPPFSDPDAEGAAIALSSEQAAAASAGAALLNEGAPAPMLLDGVTGSGKTEVYLEIAAAALRRDPTAQILIMLPEIALTMPFLARVEERFNAAPAPWHSELSPGERRRVWRRVLDGNARIVVGARSALFLPYKNLKLIIVDEEHENAYKQEDGVIYHGRDMAVARGKIGVFPVILASATPSLETVVNVDQGRYHLERLTARFGGARLPDVSLVDMRRDPAERDSWLSPVLIRAVNETMARKEQTVLFLNRRGYAPLTICRKCGHRMKAPHSDTWLVEHRFENKLVCHHTGFSMPKPDACPKCNAVGALAACGPGVERVAEEAARTWPNARLAVLSSDTAQTPQKLRAVLSDMRDGKIDILVATQVIAKGHHFPNLTLVGVVDADMGLAGGDLRAAERTYQLLSQVAGRAGRGEKPGRALLQTFQPDAPVLKALAGGERDDFLAAEAQGRMALGFPPYGRLAAVVLRGPDEKALQAMAEAHRAAIPKGDGVEVWGPAPAPFYRLRGQMRIRFLVKARRDVHIQKYMDAWLGRVKIRGGVRRTVDIDPYSFL